MSELDIARMWYAVTNSPYTGFAAPDFAIKFARAIEQSARRSALESAAVLCDEYGELAASEKDSALLVGKVDLSNAMSGEPRAASFLGAAIRALAASDSDGGKDE